MVGDVTEGPGSRIAGGAFVNRDLPPYSLVLGNPAQIIREGCMPDVDHPAPVVQSS